MTNYNERLDELMPCDCKFLKGFAWRIGDPCEGCINGRLKQAIIDWHNKQVEEVLDRLKAGISADIPNYYDQDGWEVAMKHIKAERAKLKGGKNDQL